MAKEVKIIVRGIRRKEPDLQRLARALIQLASDAVNAEQTEVPAQHDEVQGEAS
jgi:hypothetical protein